MSTSVHAPSGTRPSPDSMRRTSRAAGIRYLVERVSPLAAVAFIPIAVCQLHPGVYLVVRGLRPAAVAALPPAQAVR